MQNLPPKDAAESDITRYKFLLSTDSYTCIWKTLMNLSVLAYRHNTDFLDDT